MASQFAFPNFATPAAAVRAVGISTLLARLRAGDGCGGADPSSAPDWVSSPLQLRVAGDYIAGTAIGAPIVVVAAALVGCGADVLQAALR
jgi:hypothetical protein